MTKESKFGNKAKSFNDYEKEYLERRKRIKVFNKAPKEQRYLHIKKTLI